MSLRLSIVPLLALLAQPSSAVAEERSYWGDFPARSDSTTAMLRQRPTPLWETALLAPYEVARLPLRGVTYAAGKSVVFLDDTHVLYRVGKLLAPRRGPFGVLINMRAGGLSGFGGGLTVLHDKFFGPDNRFKLRQQSTVRGRHKTSLGISWGQRERGRTELGAGYDLRPEAQYFGTGPESKKDAESRYKQELTWTGLTYAHEVGGGLAAELGTLYSAMGARATNRSFGEPLREVFAGSIPAGYGHRSDGVQFSAGLHLDTTKEEGRPETGRFARAVGARFESTDGSDVAFWTWRAEAQQFVPLWFTQRALAVRGFYSWIDPIDGSVPFQRLMTNDDPDLFRGYKDFRWRGRGMTSLTVEYRWPVWAPRQVGEGGLDAYLLGDFGQVFDHQREVSLPNTTSSFGGGFRFIGVGGLTGRIEIARSREETVFRLRGDQLFQFKRGDLYHGRNPVPVR